MPSSSRPGTGRSRGRPAPPASTIASNSALIWSSVMSTPTFTLVRNVTPSCSHQRQPAVQELLLHLEFRNAVAQQAADTIGLLKYGHEVARAIQLLGRSEAGGTRTDHGDFPARAHQRRLGRHPSFVEGLLDDGDFDRLDRHRVVVDAEHARAFARRRTQPAGELGEVVRRVQPLDRRLPAIAVDQIVPVGNQIAQRASLMAERDAAVHAPRALLLQLLPRIRQVDFVPVLQALGHRTGRLFLAMDLDKTCRFTHNNSKRRSGEHAKIRERISSFERISSALLVSCYIDPTSSANSGSRFSARALPRPA